MKFCLLHFHIGKKKTKPIQEKILLENYKEKIDSFLEKQKKN